jgi:hypothetical protein
MTHFSDGVRAGRNFANNGTASEPGVFMSPINVYNVVPATLDADGICAQQTLAAAGNALLNGALASGGTVTLDVPRIVIIDAAGAATAVLTVTGTDVYGIPMSEAITLNGTTAVSGARRRSRRSPASQLRLLPPISSSARVTCLACRSVRTAVTTC